MTTTLRKLLNHGLMVAVMASLAGAGCVQASSDDDTDEAPAEGAKEDPADLTERDVAEAIRLDLSPGVPWEATARGPVSSEASGPGQRPLALTTIDAQSWAELGAGQSRSVTFTLSSSESMAAYAQPYDELGNIDLALYKWDAATASWTFVKSSINKEGYIDSIFTPPYTPGWDGKYLLKLSCNSGPCNFSSYVTKGDDQDFHTLSVYLNQRMFAAITYSCQGPRGAWIPDGECMCSDASAAMGLVAGGKRKISDLASAAYDLFENTNRADGGGNRFALMARLKANYGYAECADLPLDEGNIRSRLRTKWLTLLRSPKFSPPGHYVQVRGYKTEGGVFKVRVNDPYGVWSSNNVWSPRNTPDAGYGEDSVIQLSLLKDPDASLVVCK